LKFARYLPSFGWTPTVIAPRDGFYHRDPTLDDAGLEVVRTPSCEISRIGRGGLLGRAPSDVRPSRPRGLFARIQGAARRHLYRPDPQIGWLPFGVAAGRGLLRDRRFAAVFSSSFPITAHLVARRLKADFAIPWVAEFRDPWTELASYDRGWRRRADEDVERAIVREADVVVTVSRGFAEVLARKGARRVAVIPNGFDPSDYPEAGPTEDVVAYLGTFYPGRQDLETALRALAELESRREGLVLRLRSIGAHGPEVLRQVSAAGIHTPPEVTGFLAHRPALAALSRARLLLLAGPKDLDAADPVVRGWIPAKVFEYLGAARPILYVGNPRSEVAELVRASGAGEVVRPGDVEAAVTAIARLTSGPPPSRSPSVESYTRQALAGSLASLLDQLA
jgi:glycosyltransferase involved in cell wall biosynthesis